jgi:hypothetical protein
MENDTVPFLLVLPKVFAVGLHDVGGGGVAPVIVGKGKPEPL